MVIVVVEYTVANNNNANKKTILKKIILIDLTSFVEGKKSITLKKQLFYKN